MEITEGDKVLIIVRNDGSSSSFLTGDDFLKDDSLGLRLVRNLVQKQLKGTIKLNLDKGTEFTITFKTKMGGKDG